jgi:hypothetical protein
MKVSKLITAILFVVIAFNINILAQNPKPTPKRKKTPVVTTPTQIYQPEIVSTANENNSQVQENSSVEQDDETTQTNETIDEKLDKISKRIKDLGTRIGSIETNQKKDLEDKQKKLLLNLDILSRAEQRAESLRKQLFDIIEKENDVKQKLNDIDYQIRPEIIERSTALSGSLRPEDLREQRKKSLETDRSNQRSLLSQIQITRTNLEDNVAKADLLVEKLRLKFEKEIDDILSDELK